MTIDFSTFNSSQHTAAMWQDGPLLVLAGPGSGKTRVLTYRIARLIDETPEERFRVLGVTFTNKAATEMRNRVDSILDLGRDRATLTTFHSFAAEILRQHGSHVGLRPDFTILSDQTDREAILSDVIRGLQRDGADITPRASQLLPVINRMLEECIRPDEASSRLAAQPHSGEIAAVYGAYRAFLVQSNQLDFASLIATAVDLLETRPAIAKLIHRIYPYICVDECQDTNAAQFRFLIQLVPAIQPNLFVVADDDQMIYQWNGASPARLQDLRQRFKMQAVQLPENYRCPPEVIDLANNLIAFNTDRSIDKVNLTAHKTGDGTRRVEIKRFSDFQLEINGVADFLDRMPENERPHCVILSRRRKLLDEAVEILDHRSIPAYIAVRKSEFQSAPYRWLHSTLRLANAPQDRDQLRRMSTAFYDLEGVNIDVEDVVARAAIDLGGLFRSWLDIADERSGTAPATQKVLSITRRDLLDRLDYWPFVDAAHDWFSTTQPDRNLSPEAAFVEFDDEHKIWNSLKSDISSHYALSELSLHNFLQELDLRAKEKPVPRNAVRCLTIAASKGMEFRHVFLIGLVEDELPSFHARRKGDNSPSMREERRNCFVAITRAEETLTLTFADSYFGWPKSSSRFIAEMGLGGS